MYKLYTDKKEIFEADITLQGASLKDAFCRLIVESSEWNLVFPGTISNTGKCQIVVEKLSKILSEGATGTLKLEVIAEETYFTPWQSPFTVEANKKLAVEVKSQPAKMQLSENVKPVMKAVVHTESPHNFHQFKQFIKECINNNITFENINNKKRTLSSIVEKYYTNSKDKNWIIENTLKVLYLKSIKD